MAAPRRIDVHHHLETPAYIDALNRRGGMGASKFRKTPWQLDADRAYNAKVGVSTAILSLSAPGGEAGESMAEQVRICREANDTAAAIRDGDPAGYGFFAVIPSPADDMAAALAELGRALDDRRADGITLLTSYAGKHLGHQDFVPLWAELDRRRAVVFVHPTPRAGSAPEAVPDPVLEFPFETTRTAMDMILAGTLRRFKDVCVILSHAGGTLPYLWERAAHLVPGLGLSDGDAITYEQIREGAADFYYDTAISGGAHVLGLLAQVARPGHILFGSDYPYCDAEIGIANARNIDAAPLSEEQLRSINREAALELFPRLKGLGA